MQLSSVRSLFRARLQALYPEQEIESIFDIAVGHVLNYSKMQLHQNLALNLSSGSEEHLLKILDRVSSSEPIQYVTGETEFYSLRFKVDKSVLIPRPETEYLVDMVIKKYSEIPNLKILDVGTGSGCIAVALASKLILPEITAIEKSIIALNIASLNASINHTKVLFIQDDFLNREHDYLQFNIVISNPPYVTESEKRLMHRNILEYEPPEALFVSDSDPLIFYRHLAEFAEKHLFPGGEIFLEINEKYANETATLFVKKGFREVSLHNDLSSKKRYLTAMKKV